MKNFKLTKKLLIQFVKIKLQKDLKWATHACVAIHGLQTYSERNSDKTREKNGVGFSAMDAEVLSEIAKIIESKKDLDEVQIKKLIYRIKKYSRQIYEISNKEKLKKLALIYYAKDNATIQTTLKI